MDPTQLLPAAEAIPVPWGWFEALLLVTFVAHILLMNVTLGSAIIALAGRVSGRQRDLARELARRLPTTLALTINLGVAPLLFLQVLYGQFHYTASVLMAAWWLSVVAVLIVAYYGLYVHEAKYETSRGLSRLALTVSLALMLFVGFMLANNMTLMLRPEAWSAYFQNPHGTLLNLTDRMLAPRYLHMMLAAPAVAGLYAALLGGKKRRPDWVEHGLAWFTRLTMLQILVGGWLLLSLPLDVLLGFMGQNALATGILAASVAAGLAALMAGIKKRPGPAAGLAVLTVLLMAATRDQVRLAALAPYFSPKTLPVTGEFSPLLLFLCTLLLGLGCIAYMLRLYSRNNGQGAARQEKGE